MQIMRKDYDKPHRCSAWSGPGWVYSGTTKCSGGSIDGVYDGPLWKWKVHRHEACGTYSLPYVLKWFEWRTWRNLLATWRFDRGY
jgi:hypothetical protein